MHHINKLQPNYTGRSVATNNFNRKHFNHRHKQRCNTDCDTNVCTHKDTITEFKQNSCIDQSILPPLSTFKKEILPNLIDNNSNNSELLFPTHNTKLGGSYSRFNSGSSLHEHIRNISAVSNITSATEFQQLNTIHTTHTYHTYHTYFKQSNNRLKSNLNP